jgi:hypothetical protein
MRRVRISRTATLGLQRLLEQGLPKFGQSVIDEKYRLVDNAIFVRLSADPRFGSYDERQKFYAYPVAKTPFTIVYRFDDTELLILFIVHQGADRTRLDTAEVRW